MLVDAPSTTPLEKIRISDLLRLLPRCYRSALEIGPANGRVTEHIARFFPDFTVLDVQRPSFDLQGVKIVMGSVTNLPFPNNYFDFVLCTEVLEHVTEFEKACREIIRVTRHEVLIGTPYRQDVRVGRTTCQNCGAKNPPFGHFNSFSERDLRKLFPLMQVKEKSLVGQQRPWRTNTISVKLMDFAGNPWGTYGQEDPCSHCGTALHAPSQRNLSQKIASKIAFLLNRGQRSFVQLEPVWIHLLLEKK
jgi:SAM-dependent methyltransferase